MGAIMTEAETETAALFEAATKIDLAGAVKHIRDWRAYIDERHRQKYADLIEAQAKLIAHLVGHAQTPGLREALEFYADPTRYNGPNQRLKGEPDKYQPENLYYRLDVTRDGGAIARRTLSNPDTSTVCTSGEPHERTYLRGWNEAIERCAEIAESSAVTSNGTKIGIGIATKIRSLADTRPDRKSEQ